MKTKITHLHLVLSVVAQSFLFTAFSQNVANVTQLAEIPEIVVQKGFHDNMGICLSPNGKYLVETGQYISIYDTETGIEIKHIYNDQPGIEFHLAVFSPNSKYIAVDEYYPLKELSTVSIFDIQTGKKIANKNLNQKGFLWFSKDSKSLYSVHANLIKWDFVTDNITTTNGIETFKRDSYYQLESATSFCFDPDFKRVALGMTGRIAISNTYKESSPTEYLRVETDGTPIAMAFSADNKTLHAAISSSNKGNCHYIEINAVTGVVGKRINFKKDNWFFKEMSNNHAAQWLNLCYKYSDFYRFNLFTGTIDSLCNEKVNDGYHYISNAFTIDGKKVFSRRGAKSIGLYDYEEGKVVKEFSGQLLSRIKSIDFTTDGKYVILSQEMYATPGEDTKAGVFIWDVKNVKPIKAHKLSNSVTPITGWWEMLQGEKPWKVVILETNPLSTISKDNPNRYVVTKKPDKQDNVYHQIYDLDQGLQGEKYIDYIKAHSSDGRYWAENLKSADSIESRYVGVNPDNNNYSSSFEFSKPYSRWDYSYFDISNYGFQIQDKQAKKTIIRKYYKNAILNSAFSPDSKLFVVTYCPDKFNSGDSHFSRKTWIDIFSTDNWQLIESKKLSDKSEFLGRYTPDGKYFATRTGDSYISLFDATTWQFVRKFEDGFMFSTKFDFSPDSKLLVTGGKDCKVTFYDVETGKVIYSAINMLPNKWIAYTPDNYFDSHIDDKYAAATAFKGKGISIDQMAVWYNRPDILLERIGNEDKNLINHYKRTLLST